MADSEDPPPPEDADSSHNLLEKPTAPIEPGVPSEHTVLPETAASLGHAGHSEPIEPSESTAPSEPAPDAPLEPAEHSEPTEPSESTAPSEPAPAAPLEPSERSEPTEPTGPTEPPGPDEPLEPAVSSDAVASPKPALQPADDQSNDIAEPNIEPLSKEDEEDYSDSGDDGSSTEDADDSSVETEDDSDDSPPLENGGHVENGVDPQDPTTNTAEKTEHVDVNDVLPSDFWPALSDEVDPMVLPKSPLKDPVVSRQAWGAKPPRKPIPQRKGLISRVICSHTNSSTCETEASCVSLVRSLQGNCMADMGNIDLPYNFLLGGDGRVYEGRGWHGLAPFPKYIPDKYNDGRYLEVAFMGNYNKKSKEMPTELMVQARRNLVSYGDEQGFFEGKEIITFILAKI